MGSCNFLFRVVTCRDDPTPTPYATPSQDQPLTHHDSPPQDQPTTPYESFIPLLTTLMEICATLSQKVAELEQDKHTQALEILQLKKRVKRLEMKMKSKHSGFKRRMHPNRGKIKAIDTDEGITLVKEVSAVSAPELVSAFELTIAQKLHDEEVLKAAARDKQEKADMEKALELQRQYDDKEENIEWSVVVEQESFKKLKADEVSGSKSTQESSSDLKEMTEEDVQSMLEIIPIIRFRGITEAYQVFEDMLKGSDREDLVALWNLVKEKFSSVVPSEDKEKALWVELKRLFELDADDVLWKLQRYMHAPLTWKLYTNYGVHHVSLIRGHDIFMWIEKDYPLSNAVMILMLSGKLQVEEHNEMARDLVMKIFMEANKPKSRSFDTSSK
uniref:Uncharacterized protein n=1 Tax=Tanacetum cinerariifolium TaxID=118510 RepID=A0A6L2KYT5_TANCI|nr:hypothetical protein [Tanacetum cinerariifolium]